MRFSRFLSVDEMRIAVLVGSGFIAFAWLLLMAALEARAWAA